MLASISAASEAKAMSPTTDFVQHTCAVSSISGTREFVSTQGDCEEYGDDCAGTADECCEEWN
jgi:hypothetical protein